MQKQISTQIPVESIGVRERCTSLREDSSNNSVSESELMVARIGQGVARLRSDWNALLRLLPRIGHVKAATRNFGAVLEESGTYPLNRATTRRRKENQIDIEI